MAPRWRSGRAAALAAAAAAVIIAAVVSISVAVNRPAPIGIRNLRIQVVDGPDNNQPGR